MFTGCPADFDTVEGCHTLTPRRVGSQTLQMFLPE
jgi:hypothetical protein